MNENIKHPYKPTFIYTYNQSFIQLSIHLSKTAAVSHLKAIHTCNRKKLKILAFKNV